MTADARHRLLHLKTSQFSYQSLSLYSLMSLTTVLQNHCREYIWLRVNAKAKYQQKMKTAKLLHITSYYCSNLPRPEKTHIRPIPLNKQQWHHLRPIFQLNNKSQSNLVNMTVKQFVELRSAGQWSWPMDDQYSASATLSPAETQQLNRDDHMHANNVNISPIKNSSK